MKLELDLVNVIIKVGWLCSLNLWNTGYNLLTKQSFGVHNQAIIFFLPALDICPIVMQVSIHSSVCVSTYCPAHRSERIRFINSSTKVFHQHLSLLVVDNFQVSTPTCEFGERKLCSLRPVQK